MRKLLTTLVTLLALFAVALPALADGDHDKPKKTTTTTTRPEETTTTTVPLIEVCRDGQIVTVPYDEKLETDERIWDDFDRRDCQPPRVPTPTTIPTIVIPGPVYSVGYICPGTDGVVYELPWGTYEDMWPTPESAKAYGCPVVEEVVLIAPTSTVLTELPFTGMDPGLGVLAGLALLSLGGLLVRRSDA